VGGHGLVLTRRKKKKKKALSLPGTLPCPSPLRNKWRPAPHCPPHSSHTHPLPFHTPHLRHRPSRFEWSPAVVNHEDEVLRLLQGGDGHLGHAQVVRVGLGQEVAAWDRTTGRQRSPACVGGWGWGVGWGAIAWEGRRKRAAQHDFGFSPGILLCNICIYILVIINAPHQLM
jgi:hypothetical protein